MLTSTRQLETDVENASRGSVPFTADGHHARVVLVHNDFWRLNIGGKGVADAVVHSAAGSWALTARGQRCRALPVRREVVADSPESVVVDAQD